MHYKFSFGFQTLLYNNLVLFLNEAMHQRILPYNKLVIVLAPGQ